MLETLRSEWWSNSKKDEMRRRREKEEDEEAEEAEERVKGSGVSRYRVYEILLL